MWRLIHEGTEMGRSVFVAGFLMGRNFVQVPQKSRLVESMEKSKTAKTKDKFTTIIPNLPL